MRPLRLLLATSLVAALVAVPGSTSAADTRKAACRQAVLVLRTLHIEVVPEKEVVRRGETFTAEATVTRPAHEDPFGNGITFDPPQSTPAEDVIVGLSVYVGERTYFWDVGLTDAQGKDTLKLKVPNNSELGTAYAMASARHWIKSDCPDILEEGYATYPEFVRIVP